MAFDLLGVGQSPSLYPLYSDIDSDIETSNDHNINLMVPSSIRRQRYSKSSNNKLTKTYNYYRSMQNRNRGRGRNRIYRNNNNHNHMNMNRNRNRNKRRRGRHVPKSASLNALSFITSPRPYGVTDGGDREFVYNLTQKINNISQERPSLNGRRLNQNQPQNNNNNNPNKPNSNSNSKQFGNLNQNQNKKKTQKRRIRTFYSKKWGNRLYNLREQDHNNKQNNNIPQTIRSHSCDIPDMLRADRRDNDDMDDMEDLNSSSRIQLWQNEVSNARRSLSAFIEEENLDLNDIKSPRSVSPSASPMPMHLGVDFRMDQDSQTVYYDSAASNIASNTDMDSNDEDDDDEEDIECTPTPSPNPNGPIHRDFTPTPAPNLNLGYNHNDRSSSSAHLRISRYINDDHHDENGDNENEMESSSNFKIIVSAPNNEDHTNLYNHSQTLNDRQNELLSRLKPKRSRRRYIPSVMESGASDDCSSCDDDDDVTTTGDEMEYNGKSSLFLSENNLQRGVYASFGFSDTETDYLSAQSDDFDELTICYHHRDRNHNNNNNLSVNNNEGKNIRFRNHLNDANYLSDIGPSDIGSSDTECFSSNDSIPDSIPPPLHHDHDIDDDFVSIN